ncbi:hypothetical protein Ddye_022912 [Dipteronia dyeriana]|uniref:Uncharacterized protein n=1 Tax=Dipteronia dyeriana TaxID=168575 RepID=A0AAD9TSV9_9ROSI|nr:hypothetical protein Ddye_022912 [Dipteronia dyeriana]
MLRCKGCLEFVWPLEREMLNHQLHTKKRNKLAQKRLNDLVFVKYNRALQSRYNLRDTIDPITLRDIDDSNEWLTSRIDDQHDRDDEAIFSDDDGLTWNNVTRVARVWNLVIGLAQMRILCQRQGQGCHNHKFDQLNL